MICGNCGREISVSVACGFCGYDSRIDDSMNEVKVEAAYVPPKKTKVVVHKSANGAAIAGMILSIFPFLAPIGFILNLVGLSKIKYCHKGHVTIAIGMLFILLWVALTVALVLYLTSSGVVGGVKDLIMELKALIDYL